MLQWLGHSFFIITTKKGQVIYIDPWKEGNNAFPTGISLPDPDVILVTHGHFDHLGDTLPFTKNSKKKTKVFSIFEIMVYLMEHGIPQEQLQPLNKGGSVMFENIQFSLVHAIHSSGIGPFAAKALINGGDACGFVITLENGLTIYHAGDTELFSDMQLIGQRFSIDIALLPIGDVFTMNPKAAAHAVKLLKPKVVIPMHYGGTFQLPGDPEVFRKAVEDKAKTIILQPGKSIDLAE